MRGVPALAGTPFLEFKNMKARIFFLFVITIAVYSCGNRSSKQYDRDAEVREFRTTLTNADTTTMLKLCDDAMEMLKNKRYDDVLATLHEYSDSTKEAKPLSEATAKKYRRMFELFPVLQYERIYYSFQLEGCNDVKYRVTFATAEAAKTDKDPQTAFMFNPVKVDGTWKLCVKTANEEKDPYRR